MTRPHGAGAGLVARARSTSAVDEQRTEKIEEGIRTGMREPPQWRLTPAYDRAMTIAGTYDYLMRARRDLWRALEAAPADVLSRAQLPGSRFHCIKDLVFHIAEVEDGWVNGDIRGAAMVQDDIQVLKDSAGGPAYAGMDLDILLDYWRRVERGTLAYLATLGADDLAQVVAVEDWPDRRLTVDGLLWHVMIHEMRHTAQIATLMRLQGLVPPSLDLLFYLPKA